MLNFAALPKFIYNETTSTLRVNGKVEDREHRKLLTIYADQREIHGELKKLKEESQSYLTDKDLSDLDTYAKRIRGEVLFARAWLLCEGQCEYLTAFLQELEMHSKEPPHEPDTVLLMTIHGSKGKEFDHVYLVGLVEDELPSFQSIQKGERSPEMEEERRNCFVAITRTVKTLTLSYAEKYNGWSKKPSRFLSEMGFVGSKYGKNIIMWLMGWGYRSI